MRESLWHHASPWSASSSPVCQLIINVPFKGEKTLWVVIYWKEKFIAICLQGISHTEVKDNVRMYIRRILNKILGTKA